jgi:hypothetical protein
MPRNFKWFSLIFFFLMMVEPCIYGQANATLSGRIVEQETKEGIPYASIILKRANDGEALGGNISEEDGRFVMTGLPQGSFKLEVSFVGYETRTLDVIIGSLNNTYNLGDISLSIGALQLDQVTVEAQRAITSSDLDKKSFDMSDQISQSGGSVLDVMKNLPGVSVDQEGKVMLRGSDQVAILTDGKQTSLTGFGNQKSLDNIPAGNIERIEIINNPSTKYDASGMAGIINIIYKKEKRNGWTGDVGLAFNVGDLTIRKKDLPTSLGAYHVNPKYIPSLNLNYNNDKINYFIQSEILRQKKLPNNEFTTRKYADGSETISQVPENRTQTHYIFKTGIDWMQNAANKWSFTTIVDYEGHIDTAQIPYIDLNTQRRYRYWHWKEDEMTGYLNFHLNYQHQFEEPGHTLASSLQYTRGWEDESYFLNDSSTYRQATDFTHIIATEHTTLFNLDYVQPLSYGRFESGLKLQWRAIPVTYEIGQGEQSIIYPGLGAWSDWKENIYGAYINYIYERSKFSIEGGIRAEQTEVEYDIDPSNIYYSKNDAYNYFRIFPNIRITFKLDDENQLSLFLNNRIDRPGEPNLRIFPKYDDPELLKVGNPYVRPQFTRIYEAAFKHIWQDGSFFISGYYRDIEDPFIRIYSIDASNTQYSIVNKIYHNVGSGSNLGTEILLTQNIMKNWQATGSFNWYKNQIDAFTGELLFPYVRSFSIEKTNDLTWDLKISNQWSLKDKTQLQLSFVYLAPKNTPQGKQLSSASLDLGLKVPIWKNRGELLFSATDLLNSSGLREEIAGPDFTALYENYYETQSLRIGCRYRFIN